MNRKIELALHADGIRRLAEITTHAELQAAIGYLCSWAPDGYLRVTIYVADYTIPEIVALYWKGADEVPGRPDYVIGAVWHGDHFGFHS